MKGSVMQGLTTRRPPALSAGFCLVLAGCTLASSGCHESADEKGDDDAFLRTKPSQTQPLDYEAASSLLPLKQGNWWEYQVQKTTVKDGKTVNASPYRERGVVSGPVVMGATQGMGITFTGNTQGTRTEVYASNAEGVFVLGATQAKGNTTRLTMSSPLPLLRYPTKTGDYTSWDGRLNFESYTSPGNACSRVTAWEPVKTPAGTFPAWRIDTAFAANINGKLLQEINSRWFVPGVGLVRQESRSRNELVVSVLTNSFKGSKK